MAKLRGEVGQRVQVLGPEFEELVKHKKRETGEKAKAARSGLRLIDDLQTLGALEFLRMSVDHVPRDYADREFAKLIVQRGLSGKTTTLITDDRELRVRIRELCRQHGIVEPQIIRGDKMNRAAAACLSAGEPIVPLVPGSRAFFAGDISPLVPIAGGSGFTSTVEQHVR